MLDHQVLSQLASDLEQRYEDTLRARTAALRTELEAKYAGQARAELAAAIWQELETAWERERDQRVADIRAEERQRAEEAVAKQRQDIEGDIDARVEQAVQQRRTALREEMSGLLDGLRQDLAEARTTADQAIAVLVAVVEALLPVENKSYALGRFCQVVRPLPLRALNGLLRIAGQQLEAITGETDYPIACGDGKMAAAVRRVRIAPAEAGASHGH
jgi:hypothetical protein